MSDCCVVEPAAAAMLADAASVDVDSWFTVDVVPIATVLLVSDAAVVVSLAWVVNVDDSVAEVPIEVVDDNDDDAEEESAALVLAPALAAVTIAVELLTAVADCCVVEPAAAAMLADDDCEFPLVCEFMLLVEIVTAPIVIVEACEMLVIVFVFVYNVVPAF